MAVFCCNSPGLIPVECFERPSLRFESSKNYQRDLDRLPLQMLFYIDDLIDDALGIYSDTRSNNRVILYYCENGIREYLSDNDLFNVRRGFEYNIPMIIEEYPAIKKLNGGITRQYGEISIGPTLRIQYEY